MARGSLLNRISPILNPVDQGTVLSIDIQYSQSMRLNETPTVDLALSAEEGSYSNTLLIKLSSSGFKIDPETPLEVSSDALPIRRSWTSRLELFKTNSCGACQIERCTCTARGSVQAADHRLHYLWDSPVDGEQLGALAALGGTAVAWGPFAAWLYERQACRPAGVREPVKARSDAVQSRKP